MDSSQRHAADLEQWLKDMQQDALDHAESLTKVRRAVGRLLADSSPSGKCTWCGTKWVELEDGGREPVTGGICRVCKPSFRTLVDRVDLFLSKAVTDGQ